MFEFLSLSFTSHQIGIIAGLGAALCWAFASVLYTRVPIGAGAMTTYKNSLATLCLGAILIGSSRLQGQPMFQASFESWCFLGISGIIGLSLSDIAYFRSIQILGARRGITLTLLTPPVTAVFGQIALDEKMVVFTWISIAVTILGIGIVMYERTERTAYQMIRPGTERWGIVCALIGVVLNSFASILLRRGTVGVDAIEGTFIRLLISGAFGIAMSGVTGQLREIRELLKNARGTFHLSSATFLGTVLGVWLMLVAYKYCVVGIAATVTSTTPLFIIPIAYVVYRQRLTLLAVLGAIIAFGGVWGLFLYSNS